MWKGVCGAAAALSACVGIAGAETRTPAQWPFAADSPWNISLGAGAQYLDPLCDIQIRQEANNTLLPWINAERYGLRLYTTTASDPLRSIRKGARPDLPAAAGPEVGPSRVPDGAEPDTGTDRSMAFIQPDGTTSDEMWRFFRWPEWINVGHYVRVDLRGQGWGSGIRAARASWLGGALRTWELQAGSFRHALSLSITPQRLARRFVPPASNIDSDTSQYMGTIPMGQLIALRPDVDIDALGLRTAVGRALAVALQTYGAYVVDKGGALAFTAEPSGQALVTPARSNDNTGDSDVKRIVRSLSCVSNNAPAAWGGPGARRGPDAPPWAP
jgi:hypothetical protein